MPAPNGRLPDNFARSGADIAITLDSEMMNVHFPECMAITAAGVVLVNCVIGPEHILLVTLLEHPTYTVYRRSTTLQMQGVTQVFCACPSCGKKHRSGMQWCAGGCWEPMTWAAAHERIAYVSVEHDQQARTKEVRRVYGLSNKEFAAKWSSPSGSVTAISYRELIVRKGGKTGITDVVLAQPGTYTRSKKAVVPKASSTKVGTPGTATAERASSSGRQREAPSTKVGAPVVATAERASSRGRQWVPKADVAAVAVVPQPKPAAPAPRLGARAQRTADCAHATDSMIWGWEKSAKKKGYKSHTHLWRSDGLYRATCAAKLPHPTPEWLVYSDGHTARLDGGPGDEFGPGL
jgi:hypothetical protein